MDLGRLKVLCLFVTVQAILRAAADSRCFSTGSFLDVGLHQKLIIFLFRNWQFGQDEHEVYQLHLRPVLVCKLDMLIFAPKKAEVTCLFG